MNVGKLLGVMATASVGAIIVGAFVSAANLSGSAGTIAGLFTFLLVAGAGIYVVGEFTKGARGN
jgi:hypothetical protein